jgi:hypothetical protein
VKHRVRVRKAAELHSICSLGQTGSARALDTLIVLVEHAGQVVAKKDLIAQIWSGVTVEEGSLRVHVAGLRKVLGDGKFGNRYIANIQGRGYCFVAPISDLGTLSPPAADGSTSKKGLVFPPSLSRMIGREAAVDSISAQLVTGRFVTIVGAGGIGKTTVAKSIGRRLFQEFGDLVYFVDLGLLRDPLLVASATGLALGLPINEPDSAPNLIAALRHQRMLLVFDSCEHVIETASLLAERIFNEAPQIHILATSREALKVEGEQVHRLAPLECPSEGAHLSAEQALGFSAVQLFIERATANRSQFALSDTDAPDVAEVCRRLDGIPLAIELAAGRASAYGMRKVATLPLERTREMSGTTPCYSAQVPSTNRAVQVLVDKGPHPRDLPAWDQSSTPIKGQRSRRSKSKPQRRSRPHTLPVL